MDVRLIDFLLYRFDLVYIRLNLLPQISVALIDHNDLIVAELLRLL